MPANPLRRDPSRTNPEVRRFYAAITRRLFALRRAVWDKVFKEDALGLDLTTDNPIFNNEWQFQTSPDKLKSFIAWFRDQVARGFLEADTDSDEPWTSEYVGSAYRKGVVRAFVDVLPRAVAKDKRFYDGSKAQFLRDAFAAPEEVEKIKLVYIRAFEQLKGVTDEMATGISRALADAIAHGRGAREAARAIVREVDHAMPTWRALRIARTEIIHAHASGQLRGFARLGIEEVGLRVEFVTASGACPICHGYAGRLYTLAEAQGIIPVHPNCRCAWAPANVGEVRRRHPALHGGENPDDAE